jgi:hypothetical protein
MGRFLLDGRNPQSWDDAVARFRTLQYGSMADSCRERVMGVVNRDTQTGVFSCRCIAE